LNNPNFQRVKRSHTSNIRPMAILPTHKREVEMPLSEAINQFKAIRTKHRETGLFTCNDHCELAPLPIAKTTAYSIPLKTRIVFLEAESNSSAGLQISNPSEGGGCSVAHISGLTPKHIEWVERFLSANFTKLGNVWIVPSKSSATIRNACSEHCKDVIMEKFSPTDSFEEISKAARSLKRAFQLI
jgi:hypothetical protein